MFEKLLLALLVSGTLCAPPSSQDDTDAPGVVDCGAPDALAGVVPGCETTTVDGGSDATASATGGEGGSDGGAGGGAGGEGGGAGGNGGGGGSGSGGQGGAGGEGGGALLPLGWACDVAAECADGMVCANWPESAKAEKGFCSQWCQIGDPTEPCAPGHCLGIGGGSACLPPCFVDSDCPLPLVCKLPLGACHIATPIP